MTETQWIPTNEVQEVPGHGLLQKQVMHGGKYRWVLIRTDQKPISETYRVLCHLSFLAGLISLGFGQWTAGGLAIALGFVFLVGYTGQAMNERKRHESG